MTHDTPSSSPPSTPRVNKRELRRAQALRENLRKRKIQQQLRIDQAASPLHKD